MRPPDAVLRAFGASDAPVPLPGGRGTAWRAGDVVVKPVDVLPEELAWLHREAGRTDGIRLGVPLASHEGALEVDGWIASRVLAGEHPTGRWHEIAEVARAFGAAFAGVPRPAFLDARTHAWAEADRLAWGEHDPASVAGVPLLRDLLAACRPVDEPSTVVHGDLAPNVLLDDALPPAVIDLTVYWRPVRWSVAVVAIDAVCFEGAPTSVLETIDPGTGFDQHLLRALVFRAATDLATGRGGPGLDAYRDAARRVLALSAR